MNIALTVKLPVGQASERVKNYATTPPNTNTVRQTVPICPTNISILYYLGSWIPGILIFRSPGGEC